MSGPLRKATARSQRARPFGVVAGGITQKPAVPLPPGDFLALTKGDWTRWWNSRLGKLADPEIDTPTVRRLFSLRDERERLSVQLRKQTRVVRGSKKQPVLSPLVRRQAGLDSEIRLLETAIERRLLERSQFGFGEDEDESGDDLNRGRDEDGN